MLSESWVSPQAYNGTATTTAKSLERVLTRHTYKRALLWLAQGGSPSTLIPVRSLSDDGFCGRSAAVQPTVETR